MHILGLSYNYHDAAACLLRNGVPIAAAEEERFSRVKHDARFPENAIRYCLAEAGIGIHDVACVAFYEKPARKLERALKVAKHYLPHSAEGLARQYPELVDEGLGFADTLRERLGFEGRICFAEHHVSHAASAFLVSPFDEAAILVVDGVGEWASCSQLSGQGSSIEKLREIRYPHSLGLFYAALTAFLGFRVNDDEYKVMGLASYGTPRYRDRIKTLIAQAPDGSFALDLDYFAFMSGTEMYAPKLAELLGPPRSRDEAITARHMDIAASLQAVTEDAMVALAKSSRALAESRNLCLAGGVAYNCVANSEVLARAGFDRVFIQPAAGDNGAAMGAALWAHCEVLNGDRPKHRHHTLLGPHYSDNEIAASLERFGVAHEHLESEALCERVARLIQRNLIVGWFQGRMEFGPRALGSRSILANPCSPDMKDILNNRVKFREDFRPFAPAVLAEEAGEYFELDSESPFMLLTPKVRAEKAACIPSVTHVDGTARVQTVAREDSPLFHRLISAFGTLSGVPIVINTSFNVRGEPIVCSPDDAIRCFLGTDIDFLAIGNFLVSKT
jgi:carbamoyltransferase